MTQPPLEADTLRAVADVWKRQRRVVETQFSGESMRPTIAPGDDVRIECGGDFAIGDIVLLTYAGRVILHRVVDRFDDGSIWTRGDANAIGDFPVRPSDIVGRVTDVQRDGAWNAPAAHDAPPAMADRITRALLRRSRMLGTAVLVVRWRLRALMIVLRSAASDGRRSAR